MRLEQMTVKILKKYRIVHASFHSGGGLGDIWLMSAAVDG